MKNNFDLKGYMKSNKLGAYQQLNEMWYSDLQALGQPMGMRHTTPMNEEESVEEQEITMTDLNVNRSATPFELEKTWNDMYGENFKSEYSGVYKELAKNYKNFNVEDLSKVWDAAYGEDFVTEYPGIAKWLFSNSGKAASEDKVIPTMNEDIEDDIFAGSDTAKWDNYGNETSEWDTEIAGQTVNGWTADETQGGAISWQNPKYPHTIVYATPGWEGVNGIAFEVYSDPEDGWNGSIGPMMQKVIGSHTDLWKTEKGYLALLDKAFTALEMRLTPSVDMDENYMGTQYGSSEEMAVDMLKKGITREDEDPFGAIKTGIDKITRYDDEDFIDDDKLDRFYEMGGRQLTKAADALLDDGFSKREIIDYLQNYM